MTLISLFGHTELRMCGFNYHVSSMKCYLFFMSVIFCIISFVQI